MESYTTDYTLASEIIRRVLVSLFLGLIIGIERSVAHRKIGFRTLSLVCVGSTGFTLVSVYGFDDVDTSRVAAQIVTGIGFLGAGAIIHTTYATKGLTTAAALWVAASVGMACGTGMFILAGTMTVVSLILLWLLKPFKKHINEIVDHEHKKNGHSKSHEDEKHNGNDLI